MKDAILKNWLPIVWALTILLLTGLPGNYFPEVVSFWDWLSPDKVVHFFMFGTLSFLMLWSNRKQYFTPHKRYYTTIVLLSGVAYGGFTELMQAYVFVRRDGNIYDFLANMAGTFLGFLFFMLLTRKKRKNKNAHSE
jgi:VanZ family protein